MKKEFKRWIHNSPNKKLLDGIALEDVMEIINGDGESASDGSLG